MELSQWTPGVGSLRDKARGFFESLYESPGMYVDEELDKRLAWRPTLRFSIRQYINVFVEPSEVGPYPTILDLKYAEVLTVRSQLPFMRSAPMKQFLVTSSVGKWADCSRMDSG